MLLLCMIVMALFSERATGNPGPYAGGGGGGSRGFSKCFSCHYTILCIYNEQSDRILGAILVPLYKHHLDYQMSVM